MVPKFILVFKNNSELIYVCYYRNSTVVKKVLDFDTHFLNTPIL